MDAAVSPVRWPRIYGAHSLLLDTCHSLARLALDWDAYFGAGDAYHCSHRVVGRSGHRRTLRAGSIRPPPPNLPGSLVRCFWNIRPLATTASLPSSRRRFRSFPSPQGKKKKKKKPRLGLCGRAGSQRARLRLPYSGSFERGRKAGRCPESRRSRRRRRRRR